MTNFPFDFEHKRYNASIVQIFLDGSEEITVQVNDALLSADFGAKFLFIIKGGTLYLPATTDTRKKELLLGLAIGITHFFQQHYL